MICNLAVLALLWMVTSVGLAQGFNLEDQKALMEGQIEIFKKQSDLNAAMRSWAQSGAPHLPRVVSIGIRGKEAYAKLVFSNSAEVVFKSGELIQSGLVLVKIEEDGVWVDAKLHSGPRKRLRLEYAQMPSTESWMAADILGPMSGGPTADQLSVQMPVQMPQGLPSKPGHNERNDPPSSDAMNRRTR